MQCILLCKAVVAGYAFVARMPFRAGEPVQPLPQADGTLMMNDGRMEELDITVHGR